MLNPPVILSMYFTTIGGLEYSPCGTREPWYSIAECRCNVRAIPVQLQNPVSPGCNGLARFDGHSWASHFFYFIFSYFVVLFLCVSSLLNFTLKLWIVWMWNSRWNPAKATEFHTGSTWKRYSTQCCSKLGPCFAKSFMNVSEPGFET